MDKTVDLRSVYGSQLSIETGWMAGQANGAVWVRQGDTVVLVTATASTSPRPGIDFFPLTCDYEEKMYAVGRIPGSRRPSRVRRNAAICSQLRTDRVLPASPGL